MNMEELRQQIIALQTRVEEKEHDLLVIQQELNLLKARLEDAIAQKHVHDLKEEQEARLQAKAKAEAEKARLAAEKAEAEALEKQRLADEAAKAAQAEAEKQEEPTIEAPIQKPMLADSESEPKELEISHVGEAEHEAIMRTIEEMSRSMGVSKSESTESRFAARPTLGDKVSKQKLHDIKRGIGINERFLFANELFAGDMSAFSRAVEELNHVESESDANRLMNENLAAKYRWDEEDETVLAFTSMVSRRFVG